LHRSKRIRRKNISGRAVGCGNFLADSPGRTTKTPGEFKRPSGEKGERPPRKCCWGLFRKDGCRRGTYKKKKKKKVWGGTNFKERRGSANTGAVKRSVNKARGKNKCSLRPPQGYPLHAKRNLKSVTRTFGSKNLLRWV